MNRKFERYYQKLATLVLDIIAMNVRITCNMYQLFYALQSKDCVHVRTNTFEYHCIQLTYMCFMIIIKGAHWD